MEPQVRGEDMGLRREGDHGWPPGAPEPAALRLDGACLEGEGPCGPAAGERAEEGVQTAVNNPGDPGRRLSARPQLQVLAVPVSLSGLRHFPFRILRRPTRSHLSILTGRSVGEGTSEMTSAFGKVGSKAKSLLMSFCVGFFYYCCFAV
jgi:hypothetical protein